MNDSPSLILCSTARLARSLRNLHARRLAVEQQQWQPLSAFTLNGWLDGQLEEALLCGDIAPDEVPRGRLSNAQERLLWEQAIESTLKDLDTAPLFDMTGLAAAAQEANHLLIEWNLSLDSDDMAEETRQFLLWRQKFQHLCKQGGWLEAVRYFSWQVQCVEQGLLSLPAHVALAGFDRISPLQQRLFDALRAQGSSVERHLLVHEAPQQACRVEVSDQDAECRAAVAWVQQQLARKPGARLAIVVPELNVLREKLAALLDEALQPETVTPLLAQSSRHYDFSLGVPLSTRPIIAAALNLLRFGMQRQAVPQAEISALLHNPYWSAAYTEADARAQLDALMRERLPLTLKTQRFQHFVQKALTAEKALPLPALDRDLQALLKHCQMQTGRQLPSVWAGVFRTALQQARWPGERSPSSHEFQARQSFEKTLQALADLDPLTGSVFAPDAIRRLSQLCREQIFQPEAEDMPQLQVLGMLEAAAGPLDAIWVMGMNDHVWPPAPNPNPLLPASLQRSAGTPNADSRVQMAFARAIQQRLLASAAEVVFSSALKDGERMLRCSPLLHDIPLAGADSPLFSTLFSTLAETLATAAPSRLHVLEDSRAPAVQEGEHVAGGTGLLKAQAICPAWAFYQYRLHARALKSPVNGLDAMERGTLVHGVLEHFWQDRRSDELREMPAAALQSAVSAAASRALEDFNAQHDAALSAAFIALEHGRLCRLALAWITEVEMQRPLDFAVTAREQEVKLAIEGIAIRLVIDRVDTLEDGRLVLIDYKTGNRNDFKNWADVRISEPQLPIYAAFVLAYNESAANDSSANEVAAVCYAQVRIDKSGFIGVAREAGLLQGPLVLDDSKGRKVFDAAAFPDWASLLQHWKDSIAAVARELKAGEAAIRFDHEKALAYCEALPLLRLPERQLQFERPELISGIMQEAG